MKYSAIVFGPENIPDDYNGIGNYVYNWTLPPDKIENYLDQHNIGENNLLVMATPWGNIPDTLNVAKNMGHKFITGFPYVTCMGQPNHLGWANGTTLPVLIFVRGKFPVKIIHTWSWLGLLTSSGDSFAGAKLVGRRLKNLTDYALSFSVHPPIKKNTKRTQWLPPDPIDVTVKVVTEMWNRTFVPANLFPSLPIQKNCGNFSKTILADVNKMPVQLLRPFRRIIIDPPWQYNVSLREGKVTGQYDPMTLNHIYNLPIGQMVDEKTTIAMWGTWPKLEAAFETIEQWGLKPITATVWIKTYKSNAIQYGIGYWVRAATEFFIFANKTGQLPADLDLSLAGRSECGLFLIAENKKHSQKPTAIHTLMEKSSSPKDRLEIFGRRPVHGWAVIGNDPGLETKPTIQPELFQP